MSESNQSSLRAGAALRMGFSQAVSLWPSTVTLFLARTLEMLASLVLGLTWWRSLQGGVLVPWAVVGTWISAWIFSHVLRALILGGAVGQGAQRMRGAETPPWVAAVSAGARAATWYWLSSFLVQLWGSMWRAAALIASVWAYLHALMVGSGGLLGSVALALAVTVSLPLGVLGRLWTDLALVRSISLGRGYWVSMYDAVSAIMRQLWRLLAVVLVTGALGWMANLALAGMAGAMPSPVGALSSPLAIAQSGAVGWLMAFLLALLEMTRLQAFVALTLDLENELPAQAKLVPPPVDAVPVADLVVTALPTSPHLR